tara:strand:+ start:420 stop:701 length:282 start_codon:yes stop_codon:yes gene_type:complete
LSKQELIKQLKQKNPELDQSEIQTVIENFCQNIVNALKKSKKIELRGFGSFFTKKIKEKYSARNPKTGEIIYIPEKNKVRFRASKKVNKMINK